MFGHEFYHEHIRRYVVVFGTMFNNIVVSRRDSAGVVQKRIKVPIAYSPRDKLLARIESDPSFTKPTAINLPYMGFEITSMTYAGERKLKTIQKYTAVNPSNNNKRSSVYAPVPYDINFQLSIMVKSAEDGTQILEQILPFFTPEWTNSVKLVEDLDIILDIPLVLISVSSDDTYDGDFETRRALIWTLDFTMKGYLFGPVKDKKVIKLANTNFFIDGFDSVIGTSNTVSERVTIEPGLIPTANLAGTISSSGNVVTGSGTSFTTTMAVGNYVIATEVPPSGADQFRRVTSIANNISMRVESAFSTNLVANNYQSTYNGTGTANSYATIDKDYILVTDDWDYIVTIEDA
jgi:hypothetical protein